MKKHRQYTPDFKIKCVKEVLSGEKSQKQIAKENEIAIKNVQRWVKHYQAHGGIVFLRGTQRQSFRQSVCSVVHKEKPFRDGKA